MFLFKEEEEDEHRRRRILVPGEGSVKKEFLKNIGNRHVSNSFTSVIPKKDPSNIFCRLLVYCAMFLNSFQKHISFDATIF